jgi:hypothetical protein
VDPCVQRLGVPRVGAGCECGIGNRHLRSRTGKHLILRQVLAGGLSAAGQAEGNRNNRDQRTSQMGSAPVPGGRYGYT